MMDWSDVVYGSQWAENECDPQGYEYTSEDEDFGLTNHETEEECVDDWKDIMDLSSVLHDGSLNGEGKGTQIVGAIATLLDSNQKYGFGFQFYRIDDDGELPEDWVTKAP